ncbi:MAG: hypothetical protein JXJ20_00575 [Anaerolineae bacterium]|jgi:hypothetical protein|nr:hypothetical protein [Anaerolineae bacterium]
MVQVLKPEQLDNVVNNTLVVLLMRPDLVSQWQTDLQNLLKEMLSGTQEDEAVFLAAVLNLLDNPGDTLPTGTIYDRDWEKILAGLKTGTVHSASSEDSDSMRLDQLLSSVVRAVIAVMTRAAEQKDAIEDELRQIHVAAVDSEVDELASWLDDVLAILGGIAPRDLGNRHQGVYAVYWDVLIYNIAPAD